MKYDIGWITSTGKVRKSNQDRVFVQYGMRNNVCCALLAVADGMGGLSDGDKASTAAVQALSAWWSEASKETATSLEEISESLDFAIYDVHRDLYYQTEETGKASGSTLSILYLQDQNYLTKQIGDSRIYRAEHRKFQQLTEDQTWCVRQMQEGKLTAEQAKTHRLRHALINALGISTELNITTTAGRVYSGDIFLLCSDGFYNEISPAEMLNYDRALPSQNILHQQLHRILAGPARDNISAVLCRLQ